MNSKRKAEVFQELFASCIDLQVEKSSDYASISDELENFKGMDAKVINITPFQKWAIFFGKQAFSILSAIGKNPWMPRTNSEPIRQRVRDAIIYLALFYCLLEDAEKEKWGETQGMPTPPNIPPVDPDAGSSTVIPSAPVLEPANNSGDTPNIHEKFQILRVQNSGMSSSSWHLVWKRNTNMGGSASMVLDPGTLVWLSPDDNTFVKYPFTVISILSSGVFEVIPTHKDIAVPLRWKSGYYLPDESLISEYDGLHNAVVFMR